MKSARSFAWQFYVPLLIGMFLIFLIIFSPKFVIQKPSEIMLKAEVSVLGLKIPLPVWLEKIWILRGLLIGASLVSIIRAITMDFSNYFPTRLHMDVYFDIQGIERCLRSFSSSDLARIAIIQDWKKHVSSYDEMVKKSLHELWTKRSKKDVPNVEDYSRELIHARGFTTFFVQRISLFGYRITKSAGRLDFDWAIARKPQKGFYTIFELRESPSNYIRPSFWKLLKCPIIIIQPEFKQILSIEVGGKYDAFDHIVSGLTKIKLLPYPDISDTVYLWKLPDGNCVPVAYCVYIRANEQTCSS